MLWSSRGTITNPQFTGVQAVSLSNGHLQAASRWPVGLTHEPGDGGPQPAGLSKRSGAVLPSAPRREHLFAPPGTPARVACGAVPKPQDPRAAPDPQYEADRQCLCWRLSHARPHTGEKTQANRPIQLPAVAHHVRLYLHLPPQRFLHRHRWPSRGLQHHAELTATAQTHADFPGSVYYRLKVQRCMKANENMSRSEPGGTRVAELWTLPTHAGTMGKAPSPHGDTRPAPAGELIASSPC